MEHFSSQHHNSANTNSSPQSFMSDFADASHDLLMADSAEARANAARRLATLARPLAAPYLMAALSDSAWEVRQAAVEALGDIGESGAIAPLQELLDRGNQDVLLQQAISRAIDLISARAASSEATIDSAVKYQVSQNDSQQFLPVEDRQKAAREVEQEILQSAEIEKKTLVAIDDSRKLAEVEARLRSEKEKQLTAEIQALHTAEADQARRIEEAHAQSRRHFEQQAKQRTEKQIQRRTVDVVDAELLRHEESQESEPASTAQAVLQTLEQVRQQSRAESLVGAKQEHQVRAAIEELDTTEREEISRLKAMEDALRAQEEAKAQVLAEARSRNEEYLKKLTDSEATLRRLEIETRERVAKEQEIVAAIEALRKTESEQVERIKRLEFDLSAQEKASEQAKSQAHYATEEHAKTVAELEALRQAMAIAAQSRAETEQHLNEQIQAERNAEAEHQRRIEVTAASLHSYEQARKEAEEKAKREAKRAAEEMAQLAQLQITREKANSQALTRTAEKQRLSVDIEKFSKVANEQIALMAEAKVRLTALEETRARAETKVRQRAEREIRLRDEIEALRQAEQEQIDRINQAEAEAQRLREAEARLKTEAESQRKADAEAREAAAEEERRQVAEEISQRAVEEQERLKKLQTIRAKAEAAAQKRTEQEQQLNGALEALGHEAVEQLTRIREAEARLREAEAKSLELGEEETRLLAALAAQQEADQKARLQASEAERAQLVAAAQACAEEEAEQIARLETIRKQAEVDAQLRAEVLQQLDENIEYLKNSESEQVQQIEELRVETQSRTEAEEGRLAALEALRNKTAVAAQQRAEREQKLSAEIEEMRRLETEQVKRITEAEAELVILEEERLQTEVKAQQKTERQQLLNAELTTLREEISTQVKRIAEAMEESRRLAEERALLNQEEDARQLAENEERERVAAERQVKLETEVQRRAQQEEEQLAELEAIRANAEREASLRSETEQQLNTNIQTLRKLEIEQRQRISQAEAELRQAQTDARLLAEEQIRLRTEAETLHQEQAEARRKAAEEMRQLMEDEAQQRETEETRVADELEAIRLRIETESERRVETERQLNAGIEALRKAEALQRRRIAEAEAETKRLAEETARIQAEEQERLEAEEEARQRDFAEQLHLAELRVQQHAQEEEDYLKQLEDIRSAAEQAAQQRSEKIDSINAEITTLGEIEVNQSTRIQEAEARLSEFEAECKRLTEEAAALVAEEEARRQVFAEARQRAFVNTIAEAKQQAERVAQEEKERAEALKSLRDELTAKSEQIVSRQGQLSAEIGALEKLKAEQLESMHESEAAILAHKAALQAAEMEAAGRAAEENQHLEELKNLINNSEAQSQLITTAARELRTQLETLRKAEMKQVKALQKLEERRDQAQANAREHSAREVELLAELDSLRVQVEQKEQAWPEKELSIKAQIEALRKAETVQLRRFEKLTARLQAEKQKISPTTTSKSKARSAKSPVTPSRKSTPAPDAKQWIALLQAIRSETELEINGRSNKEQQLKAEIQALHQAEIEQLQRIEEAKARLRCRETALETQANQDANLLPQLPEQSIEVEEIVIEAQTVEATPEVHFEDVGSNNREIVESDLLQPLETWQFAVNDETEFVTNVEETSLLPQGFESNVPAVEEHSVEHELSLDLQVELSNFETENQESPITEVEPYHATYFDQSEKAIQVADSDSPVGRLVEGLKSDDAATRSATIRELSSLDEDQAFSLITDLFDDDSEAVRNYAARALHDFARDCAASFTRALREASVERRAKIAAAINGSGLAAEAVESLIGESREKTHDAFSMLFLMARAGEVQLLLRTIEQHQDLSVRLSVIRLLTFCNQPNIIPAFRSLAVRATLPTEIRSAIMEAIYQISNNARQSAA